MNFVFVGLGGGLGAMLRYAVSLLPWKRAFPLLTLCTNVLGAVFIGFIAGLAARRGLSQNAQLFFKTGLCGGFTTFSTFSLESWHLLKAGRYGLAAAYMALSLVLCLLGVLAGLYCAGHLR